MNSWLLPLLQIAYGFFRGFEQGQADRLAGRRLFDGHAGYDWGQHMTGLSRATGLPLVSLKPASAAFNLEVRGDAYVVVLLLQGQTALFSVCSAITFPRGGAPRDISAGLARVNHGLERCDYELVSGDVGDFYCVQSRVRLDMLTPDVFQAGINEMLPHVVKLDEFLLDNGYAR